MDRNLQKADFNLLKVLHVLLEERNVTRAAERLFVTQSAVSRSLNRLRQLFDDPLLVRSSHGLVPTERAAQIAAVLGDTIERKIGRAHV
jgi:DNA-binding transcriptional LysR family regulator